MFFVYEKRITHTRSTSAIYINIPIVTENIHCRTCSLLDNATPIKHPITAVDAERQFKRTARLCEKPDRLKTA